MKRDLLPNAFMLICLVTNGIAFGQSNADSDAGNVCSFSIIGTWKSIAAVDTNPFVIRFAPDGWVRWLEQAPNTLPQDFELLSEVKYELDKPGAPRSIKFTARRGDDVFPPGETTMEITEYSDDSFTTFEPESGRQTQWVREQTQRYFLTFAARNGAAPHDVTAFVMWTTLDGRDTAIGALGVHLIKDKNGKSAPAFEAIPARLYNEFKEENENEKSPDVMMRLELTEGEFIRTRKVFELWEKRLKDKALPHNTPYLNGMEFLMSAAESHNLCGEKIKLQKLDRPIPDNIGAERDPPQRLLEYIRIMRKQNKEAHITNRMFPADWTPTILPNGP